METIPPHNSISRELKLQSRTHSDLENLFCQIVFDKNSFWSRELNLQNSFFYKNSFWSRDSPSPSSTTCLPVMPSLLTLQGRFDKQRKNSFSYSNCFQFTGRKSDCNGSGNRISSGEIIMKQIEVDCFLKTKTDWYNGKNGHHLLF